MGWGNPQAAVIVGGSVVLVAFGLSLVQALIGARVGSDHPVHVFLTRAIRNNGYRLFVRIPNLLNTCHCAAVPLYLHWIVAHFRERAVFWSERLLNPVVNTLHVVLFAALATACADESGLRSGFVVLSAGAFALTPQFFHALSARNFGMSARGAGLLFLTAFFISAHAVESGIAPTLAWPALVITGWLVWGFSTFGQQSLVILSVLLLVIGGHWAPVTGTALGLALFVALHPAYSISYLRHTLRFIQTYRRELAPVYILARRHSVWRDLVKDIWQRLSQDLKSGLHYAYENSVVIVLLLNPLLVLTCWEMFQRPRHEAGWIGFAQSMSLAGILAFLGTSLRPTRFLGEPERYAEVVTPWAALAGSYAVWGFAGERGLGIAVATFLAVDLFQLTASRMLLRHVSGSEFDLRDAETIIEASVPGEVRFCCNNEQITKKLMQNDWQFAYYLATGQDYCGMKVSEIFTTFPFLRREACQRVATTYRVNLCLLDRKLYDTLFDDLPSGLLGQSVAWETDRFRLIRLDWTSPRGN